MNPFSFRALMALTFAALVFVGAIYYGVIDP